NRGTAAIEKSDFVHPIQIGPAKSVLRIVEHEQDGAAIATVNDAEKSISLDLLRPDEAIIFLIDAKDADYTPDISITMKSADMDVFLPSRPTDIWEKIGSTAGSLTTGVLLGIAFGAMGVLYDYLPPRGEVRLAATIGMAVGFLLLAAASFWFGTEVVKKRVQDALRRPTPFFPYKFFEL